MGNRLAVGVILALLPLAPHAARADDLAAKIEAVIDGPDYRGARWGVLVTEADGKTVVYSHNPDRLFVSASVAKLFSSAAALASLGADHKFETPVYSRGEVKDGRLAGDLILVAQGDPTMGGRTNARGKYAYSDDDHIYANATPTELTDTDPLAGLKDLARQIKAAGIRRVEGDVLIDDRLFDTVQGSGTGPKLVSPIVINDNVVDAIITPASRPGRPARVRLRPDTDFVRVEADVETVGRGEKAHASVQRTGNDRFLIVGEIPVDSAPMVRICPVDDPAAFARRLFLDVLRAEGITVAGKLAKPELPPRGSYEPEHRVAVHTSAPFSETLKVTLKVSHNLYASTFPMLLAVERNKRTLADGMRLQGKALERLGVDPDGVSLETAAGGSVKDRVSPRATVQLLRAMTQRPDWDVFKAALPVLGIDGTLADVVGRDSPVRAKVSAKTGTYYTPGTANRPGLLTSKALAGTMTTAKGRTLLFAVFVNDVKLPRGVDGTREGKAIGRLCEILYQNAP